jgi:hypothetical protein
MNTPSDVGAERIALLVVSEISRELNRISDNQEAVSALRGLGRLVLENLWEPSDWTKKYSDQFSD